LPQSTGFGLIVTDLITGAVVSTVTVLVTVVVLPAESFATTVMVFVPVTSVSALLKVPSDPTVTVSAVPLFSLTVTVTGLEVASLVVPVTVTAVLLVTSLSAGAVIESVGGTVSILNVTVFCVAAFPSKSDASILIVWLPSARGQ
jgi:hypothetical protein